MNFCRSLLLFLFFLGPIFGSGDKTQISFDDASAVVGNCVNVITGDFIFNKTDLYVNAIEPISLNRSYVSGNGLAANGGWSWFPHICLEYSFNSFDNTISLMEPSGLLVKYSPTGNSRDYKNGERYLFLPVYDDKSVGFTNLSGGDISGKTNFKNNKLYFNFPFSFELVLGNGGRRFYEAVGSTGCYFLTKEVRPSGNKVIYSYDGNGRPVMVKTTNPKENVTYAWVRITYIDESRFTVEDNFGRKLDYGLKTVADKNTKGRPYLQDISASWGSGEKVDYEVGQKKYLDQRTVVRIRGPLVKSIVAKEKHRVGVEYYFPGKNIFPDGSVEYCSDEREDRLCRVRGLLTSLGEGELYPAYSFKYFLSKKNGNVSRSGFSTTEVYDAEGNLTRYDYSGLLRLDKISYYSKKDGKQFLHSSQNFHWGVGIETGFLKCREVKDESGKTIFARQFDYDDFGNVVREELFGNLSGRGRKSFAFGSKNIGVESFKKTYSYSTDGMNLLLSERDGNISCCYEYKPGTDLVISKLTFDGSEIIERKFYFYNEDNLLVKEIQDDGSSKKTEDLAKVTKRLIKYVLLKKQAPAIFFPETIEEKYYDLSSKKERLLKKSFFYYSLRNEVIREDVYDGSAQLRYSLHYKYNDAGQLVEKIDPLGRKSTYSYDGSENCVEAREGGEPCIKKMMYDASNRLVAVQEIGDRIPRSSFYAYDHKHNLICSTDFQGHRTFYDYDGFGRCVRTVFPEVVNGDNHLYTPVVKVAFDACGNVISMTDGRGFTTLCSYNFYKKTVKSIDADGSENLDVYNPDGTLDYSILQDGSKITYSYNSFRKVVAKRKYDVKGELLTQESWRYKGDTLLSYRDPAGVTVEYGYDGAGRKIEERVMDRKIRFCYDALGYLEKKIDFIDDSHARVEITKRDVLGRIIEERIEDLQGKIFFRQIIDYDQYGNKSRVVDFHDSKMVERFFYYDDSKRLTKEVDPLGNITEIFYDDFFLNELGQYVTRRKIVDQEHHVTIETMDAMGRTVEIERKNPLEMTVAHEKFFYDARGNRIKQLSYVFALERLVRRGVKHFEYNSKGLVIGICETSENKEKKTKFYYDTKGRLVEIVKPDGRKIFQKYDFLDRIVEACASDNSFHYLYKYDIGGNPVLAKDLLSGKAIERKYNSFHELVFEKFCDGFEISRSYDNLGRFLEISLSDGTALEYFYDEVNLLKVGRKRDGKLLYEHNYLEYDLSLQITKESLINNLGRVNYGFDLNGRNNLISSPFHFDSVGGFTPAGLVSSYKSNSTELFFDYDDTYQLKSENGSFTHSYLCDSHTNCLMRDGIKMEVNGLNQLIGMGCDKFESDQSGNIIRRKRGESAISYEYDALDRLTRVISAECRVDFIYDAFHRRMAKEVYRNGKKESSFYIYLDNDEMGAVNEELDLKELKVPGFRRDGRDSAVAIEISGKVLAPLHDIRGNIVALIDEKGKIAASYLYSAFKEERNNKDSGKVFCPWRFCAKRHDEETGLIYFGRRYYDQELGRWLSPDPSGFADGPNLYAYLLNSPLFSHDPYGLKSKSYFTRVSGGQRLLALTQSQLFNSVFPHSQGQGQVKESEVSVNRKKFRLIYSPRRMPPSQIVTPIGLKSRQYSPRIYWNGMNNTLFEAIDGALALHMSCNEEGMTIPGYSQSYNPLGDLVISFFEKMGYETPSVKVLKDLIIDETNKLINSGSSLKLFIYTFSRGALDLYLAAKSLSDEQRERLIIINSGPAKIIPKNYGFIVKNFISEGDVISELATSKTLSFMASSGNLSMLAKMAFDNYSDIKNADVQILSRAKGTAYIDHSFKSPTYQNQIRLEHMKLYPKYGILRD